MFQQILHELYAVDNFQSIVSAISRDVRGNALILSDSISCEWQTGLVGGKKSESKMHAINFSTNGHFMNGSTRDFIANISNLLHSKYDDMLCALRRASQSSYVCQESCFHVLCPTFFPFTPRNVAK